MRCSKCTQPAVTHIDWKGKNYCKDHFRRYFLGQVGKVVNKYNVSGSVAVALSGGKDSAVAVESLTHFKDINVRPFYIDLGIDNFSSSSLNAAKKLAQELGVVLDVVDLKESYQLTLPKIHKRGNGSMCALCGLIKRYLMNKYAYENGFDWLAMAKLKPLYWLKDEEVLIYAQTNDVPFTQKSCPYSPYAPTLELKDWLRQLDSTSPGILRSFAESFTRIGNQTQLQEEGGLMNCESCGYAASTTTCKFCKVMSAIGLSNSP